MREEFILKEVYLTQLTNWLNENKKKLSGKKFTASDVQQYIFKMQKLPEYLGGNKIVCVSEQKYKRTYNLMA
jgi:hypothetical protein